jgi:hypothetical protein
VLEVVRGSKAWGLVQAADPSNKAADPGYEYLLARIKFVFPSGGILTYTLDRDDFKAYSQDNKEYVALPIVAPKPAFIGTVL